MDWSNKFVSLLLYAYGSDNPFGAGGMADLLVCHIVCKYSVPWFIVHDQDTQLTADLYESIWKLLGIKSLLSIAYHPKTDGQAKCANRSIG